MILTILDHIDDFSGSILGVYPVVVKYSFLLQCTVFLPIVKNKVPTYFGCSGFPNTPYHLNSTAFNDLSNFLAILLNTF